MTYGHDTRDEYRPVRQTDLAGGVNNSKNETLLAPNESPNALNVDFDRGAVESTGGAIKFNNQTAPGCAVRTRCDPALSPLMASGTPYGGAGNGLTGTVDVPLRGSSYFPYCPDTDIGGRYDSEGDFLIGTEEFHIRRGRSFELDISFQIPPEEKLYEAPTNGAAAPAPGTAFNPDNGFDEALDECICIVQKGGDRLAPMSWALAIVNVGNGAGLSLLPTTRVSNYALVFMWYDAPQWGEFSPTVMKYNLASGTVAAGDYSTQAYRAVLIHKYVEPGVTYHAAVQLALDTGTPADAGGSSSAWNADGSFKVIVAEQDAEPVAYTYVDTASPATSLVEVVRGPTDSLRYLCRYGVRFAGRDAMFAGHGMRFHPWMKCGFIPFGMDCAPLKSGGFAMVDRSVVTATDLYGAATYTLTTVHTSGDAYVRLGAQYMSSGDANFGADPKGWNTSGTVYSEWSGLNIGAGANANALRGYRLVAPASFNALGRGAIFTMLDYVEAGGQFRMNILNGATAAKYPSWTSSITFVQCFRWHQRELILGQLRIWGEPRDYSASGIIGSRRSLSLRSSIRLDDKTEPDIATLIACWNMDDAEGGRLRELVVGGTRDGFLLPFANATTDGGTRGEGMVFLSGEGEALTRDLSDDPIFQRELEKMLQGSIQGFGFEITCVFTEAFYAIPTLENLPDPYDPVVNTTGAAIQGYRPRGCPDLLCWDVKDATKTGQRSVPRPLLVLSTRNLLASTDPRPFTRPMGFSVAVARSSDQENFDPIVPSDLMPWYRDGSTDTHYRYDPTAPWVGRSVTIQVGIQSTGTADTYDVYIAMTPKDAFLPADGDPADAEFAYWTDGLIGGSGASTEYENNGYFTAAHLKIRRKDLARSVLTVGGRWNCKGNPGDATNLGYGELNARMLVDEVRWFITSPAGALPTASGGITPRNGKLEGANCLPPRMLTSDDMLAPLGAGARAANVTQNSTSVTAPSQAAIFTGAPFTTQNAVKGCYLRVTGDEMDVKRVESFGNTVPEWYFVQNVAATGASLTLATAYADPTRVCAVGGVFRLAGYCAFEDDVRDRLLTLGHGKSYDATTTTVADVILTDEWWLDPTVPGGGWRLRIYSPLGRSSAAEIVPQWTRGLVRERRGPDDGILGVYGFNERIYAGVQGALYEADDRWREDGPTPEIPYSLAFRARDLPMGITTGLHADRVEFPSATATRLIYNSPQSTTNFSLTDAWVIVLDVFGKIGALEEFQTIMWVGDPTTDPTLAASSTGHKFNFATRLNRGRPELVIGSTSAYTGSTVPEKGLYVATMQQAVEAGEWFHARFYLRTNTLGTILELPKGKINGKTCTVRVNATDVGVSGDDDWMLTANIVSPGTGGKVLLGIGRDGYKAADANTTYVPGTIQGTLTMPQRVSGFLHSFNGQLAQVVVATQPVWEGDEPEDFDPQQIDYLASGMALLFDVLGATAQGVGHKVEDFAGVNVGVIRSHPFVSVFHEFGVSQEPIAWAEFGAQLYATNGGKPAVIIDGKGYYAGVPVPAAAPSFVRRTAALERFPLWTRNYRNASANDDTNGPVRVAPDTLATQNYHLNANRNVYVLQSATGADSTLMSWEQGDYFHLKGYFRFRSTTGRIQLWRKGTSAKAGGPFLEVRDGKLVFGWWDIDRKEEETIQTSTEPVTIGHVWYVNIRKRWPQRDSVEGNWENSFFTNGAIRRATFTSGIAGTFAIGELVNFTAGGGVAGTGRVTKTYGASASTMEFILVTGTPGATSAYTGATSGATGTTAAAALRPMKDMMVLRRFRTIAEIGSFNEWIAQVNTNTALTPRTCISLTTDAYGVPAGCNATGMVSCPGLTFTGLAGGAVFVAVPAGFVGFHRSMVGLYFVWGTGAGVAFAGKRYRITGLTDNVGAAVTTDTAVGVQLAAVEAGDSTSFAAVVGQLGGVFWGTALQKSTNYDASRTPDNTSAKVEFMGASTQGALASPFTPFDGEMWCPGWGSTVAATGTNAQCFETLDTSLTGAATADPIFTGTDVFRGENVVVGEEPGALRFTSAMQVWTTDGQVYLPMNANNFVDGSTSQPAIALTITRSATPTSTATSATATTWTYLQAPAQWQAQRQVAVAFYDARQNIVGDAGPQLTVKPSEEDPSNPSGAVRVRLSNLPITNRATELWIYQSVADGTEGALFRVARVAMGTSEVTLELSDEETSIGIPLAFTNAEPPRCDVIATSGARVVYGGLEIQPDAIVASQVGFPGLVDFSKVSRFNSGFGDRVTALIDLDGFLVVFKRRAVAGVVFDATNNVVPTSVSSGTGCVAHLTAMAKDGAVFFLSDKGLQRVQRNGVTNLALPEFIGESVKQTFEELADKRRFTRACAALNQRRAQYVLAFKLADSSRQSARVSLDVGADGRFVFSLYDRPNVTALASVQREGGGLERFVGGTEEGFMVWLDDRRTARCMLGESGTIWGQSRASIATATTAGVTLNESGRLDTALEGERGVVVRWEDEQGELREALCLGTSGTTMHFDELLPEAPSALTVVTIGASRVLWETAWLDMGNPERPKATRIVDLVMAKEASGMAKIQVYGDLDGDEVLATYTLDLSKPPHSFPLEGIAAHWIKLVVSTPIDAYDVHFELASLVWRVDDQGQE